MSEKTKFIVGKIANIIATIIFVIFIVVTFAGINMTVNQFVVLMAILLITFTLCTLISHFCLKDYKPD